MLGTNSWKMQNLYFALFVVHLGSQKNQQYDTLVIDEAAYLKECESLIPLAIRGIKHVVLIGDDKQLQPVVKSPVCLHYKTI